MRSLLPFLLLICFVSMTMCVEKNKDHFSWTQGPAIPDTDGLAGAYVGTSNNALLIAGGTNFPGNKRPWSNGIKTWYDKIFVLEQPNGVWKEAGRLERPMGYGISLSSDHGLICLGGGDAKENFAGAFIIQYIDHKIETEKLPDLPAPLINAAGVLSGDIVYVIGGIRTLTDSSQKNCWSLDLAKPASERTWQILAPMPGASRMLAMAGSSGGNVYVFGGVQLLMQPGDAPPQRRYLKDCWEYKPGIGWKQIADLPYPLAAAPAPAYNTGSSHLILFGGDDGTNASRVTELKDGHPGFRDEILAYNTITNTWSAAGRIPVDKKKDAATNPHASVYAPVTTPLVTWNGNIVITAGEARPAVRSNKMLIAKPVKTF